MFDHQDVIWDKLVGKRDPDGKTQKTVSTRWNSPRRFNGNPAQLVRLALLHLKDK